MPRVGYPDPDTFHSACASLGEFHDWLWERTGLGPEQTVLGGFSMGSVMSYSLGLGPDRPVVGGILAFSGFIPVVEGWQPELDRRQEVRAFIAHGRGDPLIGVAHARRARDLLRDGGLEVEYHESEGAHEINPRQVPLAGDWLERVLRWR